MKVLNPNTETYEILYESILLNTEGYKGGELRLANKILDKFEAIGKLKDGEDGARGLWELSYKLGDEYRIELEDAEFALLKKAFLNVSWSGRGLRKVGKAYDLLEISG